MTDVEFRDGGGAVMKLRDFDGRYGLPFGTRERWNRLRSMQIRDSDVFICSYPKSGFHWVWEIVTMLRKGDATPIKDVMENYFLDYGPRDGCESVASPRVLTTHRYFEEMADDVRVKRCKIIYLLRDPKDVCVSYYHHSLKQKSLGYDGQFKDFVQLFLEGKLPFNGWAEHILHWSCVKSVSPSQPILVVHYENMHQFPEKEIRRLADFLEVEADDTLIRDIITTTSFISMKMAKLSLRNPARKAFRGDTDPMYRKGEIGDWKNWFPEGGQQEFDSYLGVKLGGSNLGILNSVKRYFYDKQRL